MTGGYGIRLGCVLAAANRHDSPLLAPTLDRLDDLGPLPDGSTVHLDAGYDSANTRALLGERGLHGRIARKGEKAPIQASYRWQVERTHATLNTQG
jgi:IS5 family transposase